ncbi:hypothetical protein [Desulfosporosinus lacus]|uniref:Uncharacterized protein n=1 Tax=Desulfosporosinus lacus DSM 15449 TaxID=1121420 RepID=A0A1M6BRE6_9FIRM|nr:hypothetical protein [Desulfosporosinus lacus]SHI51163.1 hypothetical protein SAMN02746098_04212 [Desulfosporosinus lacus DSM 15449]
MNKNYNSIQLFKKNRGTDGSSPEQLTKEDLPDPEQQLSELIIRPLESKEKENSSGSTSEPSPLSPGISKILETLLPIFNANRKDNFQLDLEKYKDILKWPIWSIFKKPQ